MKSLISNLNFPVKTALYRRSKYFYMLYFKGK